MGDSLSGDASRGPCAPLRETWQPILDGTFREQALATVRAIADALAALPGGPASLTGGLAGLAVLYAYLAQACPGQGHERTAVRFLEQAMEAVAATPLPASLYGGFTGVAWATAHLHQRFFDPGAEDPNEAVDAALQEHLGPSPWTGQYDLIHGLVGFGVYALERWPRPSAEALLGRVLDHLAATAERRPEGLTWWTNPKWLLADTRQQYPHGYYDLGLAHGIAGVVALLGGACARGLTAKSRPLLAEAVPWLLAQQQLQGEPLGFPTWVGPGLRREKCRVAWCYGDLGIAAALLGAARGAQEPAWEREALAVARRAAARPPEQAGVYDAGLCHGAAGLGHLFNRLFQATGEAGLAAASRFWFEQTLRMRQPGRGIAGYAAWWTGPDGDLSWQADPGLLIGAAGIALALLAAATPIEPAWDRLLLVALPPRLGEGPPEGRGAGSGRVP